MKEKKTQEELEEMAKNLYDNLPQEVKCLVIQNACAEIFTGMQKKLYGYSCYAEKERKGLLLADSGREALEKILTKYKQVENLEIWKIDTFPENDLLEI